MINPGSNLLSIQDLTRRYGAKAALDQLSFDQEAGRVIGLLGRNGAGKSTLLRILTGQDLPTTGKALVFGENPFDNPGLLARICLVPDKPEFGNLRTMEDVLAISGKIYPKWDEALARQLMERFDLTEKKRVKALSRGMQTSLSLVVGLASKAELTLFDEPSLGLDAVMRERFYDIVEEESRKGGRSFVISTHLIEEVSRILDQVIMVEHGKLLSQGTVGELVGQAFILTGPNPTAPEGATLLRRETRGEEITLYCQGPRPEALPPETALAPMTLQRLFVLLTDPAPKGGAQV